VERESKFVVDIRLEFCGPHGGYCKEYDLLERDAV
jgi:hypothetical protein